MSDFVGGDDEMTDQARGAARAMWTILSARLRQLQDEVRKAERLGR